MEHSRAYQDIRIYFKFIAFLSFCDYYKDYYNKSDYWISIREREKKKRVEK